MHTSNKSSPKATVAIDTLLRDPPTSVQTAKVADLLLAVPTYGPGKEDKLLVRGPQTQ